MRRGLLVIGLLGFACAPDKDSSTPAGSSEGSSGAAGTTSASETTSGGATSEAPTTGSGACERPAGEAVEVLVFGLEGGPMVVRPGSLTCADAAGIGVCLCNEEGIDRLLIEATLAVGSQEFTDQDGPDRIQCAMGDDGCEITTVAGTLTITRADADCVAGTIDFGAAGSGSFAVAPCG